MPRAIFGFKVQYFLFSMAHKYKPITLPGAQLKKKQKQKKVTSNAGEKLAAKNFLRGSKVLYFMSLFRDSQG